MRNIFLILSLLIFSCDGNELGSQYDENIVGTWNMIECTVSDSSLIYYSSFLGHTIYFLSIDNWLFNSNGDVLIDPDVTTAFYPDGTGPAGTWETYPNNKMRLMFPALHYHIGDTISVYPPPIIDTIHYLTRVFLIIS